MSTINERIDELAIRLYSGNSSKFASFIGTSEANIRNYRNTTNPKIEILATICEKIEISYEWMLTGQGEMLKQAVETPKSTPTPVEALPIESKLTAIKLPRNTREGIPLISTEAWAGGFMGDVQVLEYECERYVVPMFDGADFLIPIKGSSMYPKYSSGDVVACKKLESWSFFQWGKVYLITTSQGPIIKRICEGIDDEHVLIVSDNEARYSPFQLHRSEIIELSIVLGVIRME